MKRLFTSALLLLCAQLTFATGFAGTQEDDQGVRYTANSDGETCYVSGHTSNYESAIVIPESFMSCKVTEIKDYAFENCTRLTSIFIPSTVESIGSKAFENCLGNITSVTVTWPEPTANMFLSAMENATLYVPEGLMQTYVGTKVL